MKVLLIDCYIDEPGSLGVPPFIHPGVRAAYGAAIDAGAEVEYLTIDDVRRARPFPRADISVVMAGSAVPGRYIRAMPASLKEVQGIADRLPGLRILGGPAALEKADLTAFDILAPKDAAAATYDSIRGGATKPRWRTAEEWDRWLFLGADCVVHHPDFPQPLIAEIETYRGCIRWRSGGCSFCVEPLKGEPCFRSVEGIVAEATRLRELGVSNFRLGAQTCIISYMSNLDGSDRPRPNPEAIESLLSKLAALRPDVLHLDNANPAIIAEYPDEARQILQSMARHCTAGNVLALGLESADPEVAARNNLNASGEEAFQAVKLINEVGKGCGPNGMPDLLPGLNFIVGLDGERRETLDMNLALLRRILEEGLLLRRINIRQVIGIRREFRPTVSHGQFLKFKETVRQEIDHEMLRRMVPQGTVLTGIFTEMREGKITFGRQIGTYPLLVGFVHPLDTGLFVNGKVTGWGQRSITAVEYPLRINRCHISAIEALPNVGRKRAMRIFRARPFNGQEAFVRSLDDEGLGRSLLEYLSFD
ncbi:MAG: Ribosomal protein S12 methylthiotransferase RimO [Methanomassiliicoccales archaeon PtaU1.Bin124]|nr:MAG: Ribosomal protein S12 methylthiotransferase RimO [Methanomassiliicoccales archaeon PtaU1.Bin124]